MSDDYSLSPGATPPQNDHPGVIMKPPKIFLIFIAAGLALDLALPWSLISAVKGPVATSVGAALLFAGIALMWRAVSRFGREGTNVPTDRPAETLVTSGLYRYTRNPIYLSFMALYLGIGFVLDNAWMLVLAFPFLLLLQIGVIAREERYLEAKFGEAYRNYKRHVRRWL